MDSTFRWLALGATLLAFAVVTIGAWVRLTDAGLGNAVAHHVDFARAIAVRDHAREGGLAQPTALHVGWIDARCAEAHAHLAICGSRSLNFVHAHHGARRTIGFVESGKHRLWVPPLT